MDATARRLKLGFFLETASVDGSRPVASWDDLRDSAQLAEHVGFDGVFVPDHLILRDSPFWGITSTAPRESLESWTILSALASSTADISLGSFVICNSFRNPGLLAKMAMTLDAVSHGRLILGLGAGSYAPEHDAFGYPYDHLGGRLEESLQIVVPLLREGRSDFSGRYQRTHDSVLSPPAPPGRPPIWVAAYGPRLMQLAARHADAFVTAWHAQPAAIATIYHAFDEACRAVGRDPATIDKVVGTLVGLGPEADRTGRRAGSVTGGTEAIAEQLRALHAAGADYVVCWLSPGGHRGVELFAPVLAALRTG